MSKRSGTFNVYGEPIHELVGIYSGRLNDQSDLGLVWRKSNIREIIEGGVHEIARYE